MEATTGGTWVPTCDFGLSKKQHWGQKMSRKKSAEKRTQNGPNWSCANGMSCGTNGMESAFFFVPVL